MVLFDLLRRLYGPVVVEAVIDVPQRRVFEVLADPRTYPDWLVGAEDVRQVDCRFPERGAEFHHTVGVSPATIDDSTESLGTSGIDHVALLVHAGPFHARVEFALDPDSNDATRVRFTEQPVGPLSILAPLLKPSLYARNRESMRRLAERAAA